MPNSGLNATARKSESPTSGPGIRELAYADLPLVISIERRSFRSPWSVGMFALEMSKSDTIGLAAIEDERVVGYLVLSRFDRAWHLMNVAVAPECRRRGIASLLIGAAFERIEEGEPVTLEVRPSNRSAVELYERLGFRSFGLRRGYYPDNGEDALIMWKGDPEAAGVPRESFEELPAGI
jgi:ribosomal-protein-alanine N-acetyltransferase